MKKSKGVIGEFTSTRGLMKLGVIAAAVLFVHNKLSKSAMDGTKKDSITNKVAGVLGYTGAGIAA